MQEHPIRQSAISKLLGSILFLLIVGIQWMLLILYTPANEWYALLDSIITIGLMTVAGFYAWYILSYVHIWQTQLLLMALVQVVCHGVSFMFMSIIHVEYADVFIYSLPLRLIIGTLAWVILLQRYWAIQQGSKLEEEVEANIIPVLPPEPVDTIDQVSVKDGSRIHIIKIEDLYCIEACGDYVTLITADGQYIKEQTMKYFEAHLPSSFVRIHRSSIINTQYIMRVELFGKESWQIRLKNGSKLRASNAGYKLLKERLSL